MSTIYSQDTSALQVGNSFSLKLIVPQVSTPAIGSKKPLGVINNESGCTLDIALSGGRNFTIPAGAWTKPFAIYPQDSLLTAIVKNVLPNSPVNLFSLTVYRPDEEVVEPVALGNSPIGISGSVATTSGNSLKNDGNNPPVSIIESTPADQTASSFSLNNDASGFIQVLSANVMRKILNIVRGNSASTKAAITVGDSGDTGITTFYGTIGAGSITPTSTLSGTIPETQIGSGYPANILGAGALPTNVTMLANEVQPGTFPVGVFTFAPSSTVQWGAHSSGLTDDNGGSIELGAGQSINPGVTQTPHIDFHSSASARDFDTRIISSGGSTTAEGGGTLTLVTADNGLVHQVGTTTYYILRSKSNGGGNAGNATWTGTVDPGTNAAEGDLWAPN